jgi:hypothetical protein
MIGAKGLKAHVQIGAMDRKISIRSINEPEYNDLDELIGYETTDVIVYAHMMNDDDTESDVNDKQTVIERRIFVIRFIDLSYEERIIYNGTEYDIVKIEEIGRRRFLKVWTKKVV